MSGSVYLFKIKDDEIDDLYKIGKTKDIKTRYKQYKKGTEIIMTKYVNDYTFIENVLIRVFTEFFTKIKGQEYFQGNKSDMIKYMIEICDDKFSDVDKLKNYLIEKYSICMDLKCLKCNKTFARKENLMKHVNNKVCQKQKQKLDLKQENGKFICDDCSFYTLNRRSLLNHLKVCKKTGKPTTITNNNINNGTVHNYNLSMYVLNPVTKEDSSHMIEDRDSWRSMFEYENGQFKGHLNYLEEVHFNADICQNTNKHLKNSKKSMYYFDEEEPYFKHSKNERTIKNIVTKMVDNYYNDLFRGFKLFSKTLTNDEKQDFFRSMTHIDENKKLIRNEFIDRMIKNNDLTDHIEEYYYDVKKNKKTLEPYVLSNIKNLVPPKIDDVDDK